jgi:hypothetical protein
MHWVDVCGPPGVGKSTLCDFFWGPHEIPIEDRLPPRHWAPFLDEITRLLTRLQQHPSFIPAVRMNRRSVRKIATVARRPDDIDAQPYIQTALVQRGLGFGWRLNQMGQVEEVRRFFELMPVSIGVAFCYAPPEVVEERNHRRLENPKTAHEDRAFMGPLMAPAIEIAKEVMNERGVPVIEIDTTQEIDKARADLSSFASREPFDPEASGPRCEVEILQPPIWW